MPVSKILYKSFCWKLLHFLISLSATIILAHILKPTGSAAFYSLLYFFSLIIAFFSFGLDIGLNYFIAKRELTSRTASIITLFLTVAALLISLPCIYFFYTPGVMIGLSGKEIVWLAGLQIAGGLLSTLTGAVFTAHHQNHTATRIGVLFGAISLILIITTCYFYSARTGTLIFYIWYIAVFIQGLFMFLYSLYIYQEEFVLRKQFFLILKRLFRFSFMVFVINFLFFAAGKFTAFILPYWVTANEAGNYIQAYKLLEYTSAVVAFIYFPVVAITAKDEEEGMERIVLVLVRFFNTITVIGSIILLVWGRIIFPFIFGPSFYSMYSAFVCLVPALIASGSSAFFTAYFFGKGYLKYNLLSACILLLTLVLLLYPLTEWYGIRGTALALSVGSILSLLMDIYCFKKHCTFVLTDLFFAKRKDIISLIKVLFPKVLR